MTLQKWSDNEFITFDPQQISNKMEELGHQWARAHANSLAFKVAAKKAESIVVAELMEKGISATAAKEKAYLDERLLSAHRALVSANKEALEAKTTYEAAQAYVEMKRTVLSTERAAMNLR